MTSKEIAVSKEVLPSLSEDYEETVLGDRRGAIRQFRNSSGLHVREYEDNFVIHVDKVDPRRNPLGHLVMDSPETILAIGAGLFLAKKVCDTVSNTRSGYDKRIKEEWSAPFSLLTLVLPLNWFFRKIRIFFFH